MKEINKVLFILMIVLLLVAITPYVLPGGSKRATIQECIDTTVTVQSENGYGSGVYISPHCILTATHVVDGYDELKVVLHNGELVEVRQVVLDYNDDLALIYTEKSSDVWSIVGSLKDVGVGDELFLVGAPLGHDFSSTLTKGILSHSDRSIPEYWEDVFQIDAWGAPGCSGGPVFHRGKVVGICVGGAGIHDAGSSLILCEPVDDLDHWLRSK